MRRCSRRLRELNTGVSSWLRSELMYILEENSLREISSLQKREAHVLNESSS